MDSNIPRHVRFKGLTDEQVKESRAKHGANVLTPAQRDPWWKLYLEKYEDPLIRILVIAAIIAIIAGIADGKYFDGIGIIIAILLATTLAFVNEFKASKEFDILNKVNDEVPIKVIRNGNYTTTPKKEIVVGDVVILEAGEEVPADGDILEAVSFQIDESRLTGESVPVTKKDKFAVKEEEKEKEAAYSASKIMSSSMISDGHGVIEITAVGDSTEIGKTARAAAEETGEVTPLNKQLDKLSKIIGVFGFSIAALIYFALVIHGAIIKDIVLTSNQWYFTSFMILSVIAVLAPVWLPIFYDALEVSGKKAERPEWIEDGGLMLWVKALGVALLIFSLGLGAGYLFNFIPASPSDWLPHEVSSKFLTYFMISITIIVVAVPEGLPMSVTLSLAYSMRKMTASNNLVRRMHACETIGAATVICTDKTGTLTMNEMRVHEPNFPALKEGKLADDDISKLVMEAIAGNTTANLAQLPGEPVRSIGNPTEGALLLWLDQNGIDYIDYRNNFKVLQQLTFSTERKYMGTLGVSANKGTNNLYIKGAPEIVMDKCLQMLTENGLENIESQKGKIKEALQGYQERGMRTLGFAYVENIQSTSAKIEELSNNMIWLGFVAIADPVRAEVPAAIQQCRDAGIKVKIVTGDNSYTAQEIARQISLWEPEDDNIKGRHITGPEFAAMNDEQAMLAVEDLKIISRARPMDKLKLVKSLQKNNEVVAVTGDGTNDAPALNYANVGLSMGKTGTAVAKEASDIILLDDSFTSIVNAVMWGRSLYQNIQRFILFQLTINVAALIIALLGPFIGVELPFTVVQMLWINLIMDTFAALALATEPPHWSVMKNKPRHPDDFILTGTMIKNIFGVGLSFVVFFVGFLFYLQPINLTNPGAGDIHKLTIFFTVFVLSQFWNLFNARCLGLNHSAFYGLNKNIGFVIIAAAILIGQILMVQFAGSIFRTVPLSLTEWVVIIAGTSVVLWIGEIGRLVSRLKKS